MIAQPRVRKAWWMSARMSQRIRSRRNQRRSAKAARTMINLTDVPSPNTREVPDAVARRCPT